MHQSMITLLKPDLNNPMQDRMVKIILCSFAFVFTFVIFGPVEIYIANMQDLKFPFLALATSISIVAFSVLLVLFIFFILLKKAWFNYGISLLFSLTLLGYVQSFINIDHGSITGAEPKRRFRIS